MFQNSPKCSPEIAQKAVKSLNVLFNLLPVIHDVVPRGLEPRLGSSSRLSAAAATAVRQILDGVSYLERILSPALDRDAPIGWDFNG